MFNIQTVRVTEAPESYMVSGSDKRHFKKIEASLKELKSLLQETNGNRVVLSRWSSGHNALIIVFSSGLMTWIFLESNSYAVRNVYFDKHLEGRFATEHMVDFVWKENDGLFISYTEPRITGVFFPASTQSKDTSFKLKHKTGLKILESRLEPRNTSRRVPRHLVLSHGSSREPRLMTIWWQMGPNSLCPWSAPTSSFRDMANILVYSYADQRFEYVSYGSVASEIMQVEFSKSRSNQLMVLSAGQTSSLSLDYSLLEINQEADEDSLRIVFSIHIPLVTPCLEVDFSDAQDKLLILCEDRNVLMFSLNENAIYNLRTSMDDAISIMCSKLDAFFIITDKMGQMLMYDYALNVIPANYDEMMGTNPHLDIIDADTVKDVKLLDGDHVVGLRFSSSESGAEQESIRLVILPRGLDMQHLISQYLKHDYIPEAISNLLILNWNFDGFLAYSCLNIIFNHLLKLPLNQLRESQVESTLGAYFRSPHSIDLSVEREYKMGMHFLAKRFFYHLMRYNSLEKAYLLAVDLKNKQLFSLLLKCALEKNDERLIDACHAKLNETIRREERQKMRHKKSKSLEEAAHDYHLGHSRHKRQESLPEGSKVKSYQGNNQHHNHPGLSAAGASASCSTDAAPSRRRPPVPAPRKSSSTSTSGAHKISREDSLRVKPVLDSQYLRDFYQRDFSQVTISEGIPRVNRGLKPLQHPKQFIQSKVSHPSEKCASSPPPPALPPKRGQVFVDIPFVSESVPPVPPKTFIQNNNNSHVKQSEKSISRGSPATIISENPPDPLFRKSNNVCTPQKSTSSAEKNVLKGTPSCISTSSCATTSSSSSSTASSQTSPSSQTSTCSSSSSDAGPETTTGQNNKDNSHGNHSVKQSSFATTTSPSKNKAKIECVHLGAV